MAHDRGARPAWPPFGLEIPTTSPAAVAWPPMATWADLARANRRALDASAVRIGDVALSELRRRARADALARAATYTAGLGLPVPPGGNALVLGTGHQPTFAHPGIWVKMLAMARVVPSDGIGLNLVVDSDAADDLGFDVPRADGRLRRARVVLVPGGPDRPYEALDRPDRAQWARLAAEVDAHLHTLPDPAVAAGWPRARAHLPLPDGLDASAAVTALRRRIEGPRPYLDLPVSELARTSAFRRFALAILTDAERFAAVHNDLLADYRAHHGIRTGAQPFPDLAVGADGVEAPFWVVREGRRLPLVVAPRRRLLAAGTEVGVLPADPDDTAFAALALRPRALTLTAFARLVVVDLFVHGVGGGRYDRVTDAVVRAYFGVEPPVYAAATATLYLPFAAGHFHEVERRRLRRLLLDLRHNPDRFLDGRGPHQALVEEKWALIRRLERADALTRRERRAATRRIREVNEILRAAVADRIAEAQDALARLDRHEEDAEVTAYRGYPFLLFPIEAADALVDLLEAAPVTAGA